jgi:TetR/AcrR family transcriptional regulator, regulator of autoinduction and epiphytic fitness
MAKNKRDIDAQVKREDIAAHALDLFLAKGYEATSMAMISANAGIAPNTIYWYFVGKDEVFVAALDRLTHMLLADYSGQDFESNAQRLKWLMQQLGRYRQLIGTVHARLAQSETVNQWHDGFHRMLEAVIIDQLRKSGTPEKLIRMMTTVGVFVVEGLLVHPHSSHQQEAILAWLLSGSTEKPRQSKKTTKPNKG